MSGNVAAEKPSQQVAAIEREPGRQLTPPEMLQIALDRGADIEQLTKLLDLQDRWERNEARKAFVVAKAAFKAEAPDIDKTKRVGFDSERTSRRTEYRYAPLDHIADVLSPVLAQHGLSYSWETEQFEGGLVKVTCVLTHVLGHAERVSLQASPDTSGSKNNIQAIGSTVTYLQRYTLLAVTGMAAGDMDDDGMGASGGLITPEQKQMLIDLQKQVGADTEKFLAYLKIETLDQLQASRYNEAIQALEAKRKATP